MRRYSIDKDGTGERARNEVAVKLAAILTALAFVGSAWAVDQAAQLEHRTKESVPVDSPVAEATAFWERFQSSFNNRATDVFSDRFSPLNVVSWNLNPEGSDPQDFRERPARDGWSALQKSINYSLRETFFDLPGMVWLKDRQDFLAEFVRDSVGSVGEENVSPKSVAYSAVERSWWKSMSERSGLSYGVRPFRTSPYAFVSWNLRDGDKTLMLGHLRYNFRNFYQHSFEFALSIPVTDSLSLGMGSSYKFGGSSEKKGVALTMYKSFKTGGFFHVGAQVAQRPTLFAGLSKPW